MTNLLSFPGLGLELTLNRVAFTVLGHPIYWYGIIIACGFLLAVWFCSRQSDKFGIKSDDIIDMLFFAVPLCIIGARLYYVLFYLDLYRRSDGSLDWGAMVRIWDGGLAIYGAVIMAAVVLLVFCRVKRIPFLAFADLGVYGLFIGQLVGRWGNFVNVEAYGGVTELPWRMCSESIAGELYAKGLVDAAGYQAVLDGTLGVHPTFLYESLWNLAGLLILLAVLRKGRRFDGQTFLIYFAWYGLGRFWIEGMRTDSLYLFSTGIRVSQMLALVTFLVAGAVLVVQLRRPHDPARLWRNRGAKPAAPAEKEEEEHGT